MKEPRVIRRPESLYITLRRDMMAILDWDRNLALVCEAFINWDTNRSDDLRRRKRCQEEPWMSLSYYTLMETVQHAMSRTKLIECVQKLVDRGFIGIRSGQDSGGNNEYLLNADLINERISELPKYVKMPESGPSTPKCGEFNSERGGRSNLNWGRSELDGGRSDLNGPTISKQEVKEKTNYSSAPSKSKIAVLGFSETELSEREQQHVTPSALPPTPLPSPASYPANESVRTEGTVLGSRAQEPIDPDAFLGAYRRFARGAKKLQKSSPDYKYALERLGELDISHAELMACLDGFISSEWAREEGYPIRPLLKDPMKWFRGDATAPAAATDFGLDALPSLGTARDIPQRPVSASTAPDLMDKWNDAVVQCPKADPSIRRTKEYLEALIDTELNGRVVELAKKADTLYASGEFGYMNLAWLLKRKEGNSRKNWERILSGEFDWKVKDKAEEIPSWRRAQLAARAALLAEYDKRDASA